MARCIYKCGLCLHTHEGGKNCHFRAYSCKISKKSLHNAISGMESDSHGSLPRTISEKEEAISILR